MLNLNIAIIKYAIKHNLHVEYFIWAYLRSVDSTGFHCVDFFNNPQICAYTFQNKSRSCIFFDVTDKQIILKSAKKINIRLGKKNYVCSHSDLIQQFGNNIINNTSIKYFLISIFACQHDKNKPYAQTLISHDLGISVKTVQRALQMFKVKIIVKPQTKASPRSYYRDGKILNLSPNYNCVRLGEMLAKREPPAYNKHV